MKSMISQEGRLLIVATIKLFTDRGVFLVKEEDTVDLLILTNILPQDWQRYCLLAIRSRTNTVASLFRHIRLVASQRI
jgi:hypothetical protein